MVTHHMAKDQKPYDIQGIKNLPLDIRINKLIDIVDHLQNKGFYESQDKYHDELQKILND